MEIYSLNIGGKKFSQYKTFEDAYLQLELFVKSNPEFVMEIIVEEFCDCGYFETSCKNYILCEYKNNLLKKYI